MFNTGIEEREEPALDSATCRGCGGPKSEDVIQCVRCYKFALHVSSPQEAVSVLLKGSVTNELRSALEQLPLVYLSSILSAGFRITVMAEGEKITRKPRVRAQRPPLDGETDKMRALVVAVMDQIDNKLDAEHNDHVHENCDCKVFANIRMAERKVSVPHDSTVADIQHVALCIFYRTVCDLGDVSAFGTAVRHGFEAMHTLSLLKINLLMTDVDKLVYESKSRVEEEALLCKSGAISGRSLIGEWDDFAAEATLARHGLLTACSEERLNVVCPDAKLVIDSLTEAEVRAQDMRRSTNKK